MTIKEEAQFRSYIYGDHRVYVFELHKFRIFIVYKQLTEDTFKFNIYNEVPNEDETELEKVEKYLIK